MIGRAKIVFDRNSCVGSSHPSVSGAAGYIPGGRGDVVIIKN